MIGARIGLYFCSFILPFALTLYCHWLNDAVKGFVVQHPQRIFMDAAHLKVYVPEPDYLLAMKTLAARVDTMDRQDIEFLINALGLIKPEQVFSILEKYYPRQQVKPATQYFVEELFGQ